MILTMPAAPSTNIDEIAHDVDARQHAIVRPPTLDCDDPAGEIRADVRRTCAGPIRKTAESE